MNILICAGDYSGDMHAAALCKELHNHAAHITALGGSFLEREADMFLENIVTLGGFGFVKPFLLYFKLKNILNNTIKKFLLEHRPDEVILVDYYGFNIHVAALCRACSIPVTYFISPQVWASRPHRIAVLKKYIRKMFVLFPFEENLYLQKDVPVTFIGHPLIDAIEEPPLSKELPDTWHIGLLPGSRISEIKNHLPILIKTAETISLKRPGTRYSLFIPESVSTDFIKRKVALTSLKIDIITEYDYKVRKTLDMAITSSGTATLENALLGIPMVVMYMTSWFTYYIARLIIKVPYICMVNILYKKEVVPECIQHNATPDIIARKTIDILSNNEHYTDMRHAILRVRKLLGEKGVYKRAANMIVEEHTAPQPA